MIQITVHLTEVRVHSSFQYTKTVKFTGIEQATAHSLSQCLMVMM